MPREVPASGAVERWLAPGVRVDQVQAPGATGGRQQRAERGHGDPTGTPGDVIGQAARS